MLCCQICFVLSFSKRIFFFFCQRKTQDVAKEKRGEERGKGWTTLLVTSRDLANISEQMSPSDRREKERQRSNLEEEEKNMRTRSAE